MNEKIKKSLPYVAVTAGFILTVIILIVLLDKVIMPFLIHDKDTVKVPNFVGKELAEAEKMISANKLNIAKVIEQYSDKNQSGIVLNQSPKAGSEVKSGRTIYLSVSKGQETVIVPYMIGQPLRAARVNMKNKGLQIGNITYSSSDIYGTDTIISQAVLSGKNVPFGSSIDLVVSRGAEAQVKVPNLIGKRSDEAESILKESGLILGSQSPQKSDTYLPNTIINQSPESGELVAKGSKVNIVITK